MRLAVFKETPARLPRRQLQRLFDVVVRAEGRTTWPSTVNLVVTDNRQLRSLNRQFRSTDKATDVLSFNIDPPEEPDGVFGEIYLSEPYVRRQAADHGRGVWSEYRLLFCHGLLHLFGYDHASPADERAMFARQERYLLEAGGRG